MNVPPRLSAAVLACCALVVPGCTHRFEGTVAEMVPRPDVTVLVAASSYGDCYRDADPVPVVYAVTRPRYTLRIAHGDRYWPQLFAYARDNSGAALQIAGGAGPVQSPRGGDIR